MRTTQPVTMVTTITHVRPGDIVVLDGLKRRVADVHLTARRVILELEDGSEFQASGRATITRIV